MNVPVTLGVLTLIVVAIAIVVEVGRKRADAKKRRRAANAPPQRRPHLERQMLAAFEGPRKTYGEIFGSFSVWRQYETTRMEISTGAPWLGLNTFTRSLIVRHLWRMLETFAKTTAVVYVDTGAPGAMVWTAASTAAFDDCGVAEPWAPAKGRAGTLISGN